MIAGTFCQNIHFEGKTGPCQNQGQGGGAGCEHVSNGVGRGAKRIYVLRSKSPSVVGLKNGPKKEKKKVGVEPSEVLDLSWEGPESGRGEKAWYGVGKRTTIEKDVGGEGTRGRPTGMGNHWKRTGGGDYRKTRKHWGEGIRIGVKGH